MSKVLITVATTQRVDNDTDQMELVVEGKLLQKGNSFLLSYDDCPDQGMVVHTLVQVNGQESVTIRRTGAIQNKITLEVGKRIKSIYQSPVGTLSLDFYGQELSNQLTQNGGRLQFAYSISNGPQEISQNIVMITVKPLQMKKEVCWYDRDF